MTSLASIITLLQLVLSLLSSPATANNAGVQALATQAISLSAQALAQPTSTPLGVAPTSTVTYNIPTSTDNPNTPIVINVNPPASQPVTPSSSEPVLGATPESCTLTVKTVTNPNEGATNVFTSQWGQYSWTSIGVPTSTKGQLYFTWTDGSGNPGEETLGNPITQSQGEFVIDRDGPDFEEETDHFLLKLDNTSCTAIYTGVNSDGSQFVGCSDSQCHPLDGSPTTCPDPAYACQN